MIRLLRWPDKAMSLRIWLPPDWPDPLGSSAGAAVELAWRPGHPTSYALLGGWPADGVTVSAPAHGPLFPASLAGAADEVQFGLPAQYRGAVEADVRRVFPAGFELSVAAHGRVGSSEVAFHAATLLLGAVTDGADSDDESSLFARLDRALETVLPSATRRDN